MVRLKPTTAIRLAVKVLGVLGLVASIQLIQALSTLEMGVLTVFPYVALSAFAALLIASILAILT